MAISEIQLRDVYEPELTESELHKVLADEERRLALAILADQTNKTLTELATEMVTQSAKDDTPPPEAIMRVKIRLHHIHLPKLDQFGLITYNPKLGLITV